MPHPWEAPRSLVPGLGPGPAGQQGLCTLLGQGWRGRRQRGTEGWRAHWYWLGVDRVLQRLKDMSSYTTMAELLLLEVHSLWI